MIRTTLHTTRFLCLNLFLPMILAGIGAGVLLSPVFWQLLPSEAHNNSFPLSTAICTMGAVLGGFYGIAFGLAAVILISMLLLFRRSLRLSLSRRIWVFGLPSLATALFSIYPLVTLAQLVPDGLNAGQIFIFALMPTLFLLVCVRAMRRYYRERVQSVEPVPVRSGSDSDLGEAP